LEERADRQEPVDPGAAPPRRQGADRGASTKLITVAMPTRITVHQIALLITVLTCDGYCEIEMPRLPCRSVFQ